MLGIQEIGLDPVKGLLKDIADDARQGRKDRLRQAAKLLRDEAASRTTSRRVRSALTFSVSVTSLLDFEARIWPRKQKAFFAGFLESGTKASAARPWPTRAFPFLEPAREEKEDEVVDLVGIPPVLRGGRS